MQQAQQGLFVFTFQRIGSPVFLLWYCQRRTLPLCMLHVNFMAVISSHSLNRESRHAA